MVKPRLCVHVARPIPPARRSRSCASPSAPRVIRGGRAGRSWPRPQGGSKNSAAGMRGTTRTAQHDPAGFGITPSPAIRGPRDRARDRGRLQRLGALPRRPSPRPRRAGLRQENARKEQHMSYTSHDLLDAARRAIPEVSVDDVAARRTRGDEFILLDVREKEEVRAGYIGGAITIQI